MDGELAGQIRSRIARFHTLASMISDPATVAVLLQMAQEAEADLSNLEAGVGRQASVTPQQS